MQLDVPHARLLAVHEGEAITDKPNRELRLLCDHELLTVSWFRYGPGERGADPHVHREHTDAFYVLNGEVTVRLGPELEPVVATPGTLVAIPAGVIHAFDNDSPGEARFLNMHAPGGGFADYLRTRAPFDQYDPPADGGRSVDAVQISGPELLEPDPYTFAIKAELEELSVTLLAFRPGWEGVDPHTHVNLVDAFFVLDGDVEFVLGDRPQRAEAGMFVAATPGARHGFRAIADTRVLNLHAPDDGFAGRMRSHR